MPSSLIFAALAVAWLVVLVPMVARRRQEVSRTADSALQARVLRREGRSRPVRRGTRPTASRAGERYATSDVDDLEDEADWDAEEDDEVEAAERWVDDAPVPRRYRPGRGGFDPEYAAAVARAKYRFRQRVVLFLLLLALVTALLAWLAASQLWWAHGGVDLVLVCYLVYLRRQVRIEESIRRRRMARLTGARGPASAERTPQGERAPAGPGEATDVPGAAPTATTGVVGGRPCAVRVEIDDEDPEFVHLDEPGSALPFRRAAGE